MPYSFVWMAPELVVLVAGMVAAIAYRRRCRPAARRVFAGCAGLAIGRFGVFPVGWLRAAFDPGPTPAGYAPRWTSAGIFDGVHYATLAVLLGVQAAAILALVSAVVPPRAVQSPNEVAG